MTTQEEIDLIQSKIIDLQTLLEYYNGINLPKRIQYEQELQDLIQKHLLTTSILQQCQISDNNS